VSSFRVLEHPADVGIEARGSTTAEAFSAAAEGLLALLLESTDPPGDDQLLREPLHLTAPDEESLLIRWLSEIVFLIDARRFIPHKPVVVKLTKEAGNFALDAVLTGSRFDASRQRLRLEVKAVTYHQVAVLQDGPETVVRVYFDI